MTELKTVFLPMLSNVREAVQNADFVGNSGKSEKIRTLTSTNERKGKTMSKTEINGIIAEFMEVEPQKKAIEKRYNALRKLILDYAKEADSFETDIYNVIVKKVIAIGLDTERLLADFPDMKDEYGKPSVRKSIIPIEKAQEKTA
jgi:predicted phage-related endonuclease